MKIFPGHSAQIPCPPKSQNHIEWLIYILPMCENKYVVKMCFDPCFLFRGPTTSNENSAFNPAEGAKLNQQICQNLRRELFLVFFVGVIFFIKEIL